jgi:hypothetical protein
MKAPLSALLLVLSALASSAALELSPAARDAFEALKKSERFCDEHVGFAGQTPPEVIALRKLVSEKQAPLRFKELVDTGSTAGKLYALCGLYFSDYAEFQRKIKPFRTSKAKVTTLMGCSIGTDSVAEIVELRESGVVRLTGPNDSLRNWLSKHPPGKDGGFRVDICGGGWPELLVRSRQSLHKSAEPNSAANQSQPVASGTNLTSAAAGSGR